MNANGYGRLPPRDRDEPSELVDFSAVRDWTRFVLHAPGRHRWLAAACFLSVLAVSVLAAKVMPFRYQVQTSILAQRNPLMGTLTNPGMNRDWDLPTRSAREVVLRRENLVALVHQTDFLNRYLASRAPAVRAWHWVKETVFRKPMDRQELLDALVDTLEQRLWVVSNPNEGTVTITFEWSDPELAMQMVSAALQSFLEARHASEISAVGETIAVLEVHDARLKKEIAETSKDLEEKERGVRSRAAPRRVVLPPQGGSRDEDVARLEALLAARKRAVADLEEFRLRRLAELRAQLVQQATIYAEQHPNVVATRQTIETLEAPSPQIEALRAEVIDLEQQIVRKGGRAAAAAPGLAFQVQADMAEARLRLADEDPRLEYERAQLRLLLRQHSNLLERIDAARVEMDTAQAAFKYRYVVTTPPQFPKRPIRGSPFLVVVAGLLGGAAFMFFTCAVVDLRSGRIVEGWQVERQLDLPVLAEFKR